ncbi:MAG: aminotransferase class I/II-fold pyridoxal phosphate-dependent enzyme, partial [Saprospiraceae bacterium]|nr:aminotransferase class I/II-fold pyridoxal phosphate-dependent enzyme [Saprospiraceae bacterium]
MKLDKKLQELPLVKTKPASLDHLFGGQDLQSMWVADSDFQIATPIQQALIERIRDAGFGYEYKPASLFEAQRTWYKKQYDVNLVQEETLYSPSIPTTLTFVLEELTSPGDGVIIQPPVWNDFRNIIRRTKRKVEKNLLQLVVDRYEINFEDLEEKASAPHNQALIICNPHNPVGRVWTKAELSRIVDICRRHDL